MLLFSKEAILKSMTSHITEVMKTVKPMLEDLIRKGCGATDRPSTHHSLRICGHALLYLRNNNKRLIKR